MSGVRTVTGNVRAKFEVRSFNHFKLVRLHTRRNTDRHAHVERTHVSSAVHFVHLAEIKIKYASAAACFFLKTTLKSVVRWR